MGAGAALRAQAQHLRTAAAQMRTQAAALDDGVNDVQTHYPAGPGSVWEGPSADKFFTELTTAKSQLASVERSVDQYAGECEAKAGRLETQADALDRATAHAN